MRRIVVDTSKPESGPVAEAVRVLEEGGVVAFPTETVYGLCADATREAAVRRLFGIKGRDPKKSCAYLLADRASAEAVAADLPRPAERLADRFWPGPVTLVVPGRDGAPVGLRLPDCAVARALAAAFPRPLFQTSANRSGQPAALNAAGVAQALGDEVDLVLDGGRAPGGSSSTVVRCDERSVAVLRAGAVAREEILEAASDLVLLACTGNLCRSPMAEAMLRRELAERIGCRPGELARHGFRVASFGTMAMTDLPASDYAILAAKEHELDLTNHRSRPFSIRLVESARRVYCLATEHRSFLAPYFTKRPDDLLLLDPKQRDVRDPYGRPIKVYRKAAERILAACRVRAGELLADEPEESGPKESGG